jgi:hypothetical protein
LAQVQGHAVHAVPDGWGMSRSDPLRTTLEAIDDYVDRVQRSRPLADVGPVSMVVDAGRAAAEWTVHVPNAPGSGRVGILVVCDVAGDRVTDARLYVSAPIDGPGPASAIPPSHEVSP